MIRSLLAGKAPSQLILQVTDACNARCPQCGMRAGNPFLRTHMPAETVRRLIDRAAANGVRILSFTGGEPLLRWEELAGLIRHATDRGIVHTRTGTNGFLFARSGRSGAAFEVDRVADALAGSGLRTFWISLDSTDAALHESSRGLPGVVEGIAKALPLFHARGLYPSANLGITRLLTRETLHLDGTADPEEFRSAYRDGFREFFRHAAALGFTIANACYPMSDDTVGEPSRAAYRALSADAVVGFRPAERVLLFRALSDAVASSRDRIRIFTPRCSLLSLARRHSGRRDAGFPCRGGREFLFIAATGETAYPCGYRGDEPLGSYGDLPGGAGTAAGECRDCDWECFRDPSELLGPVLELRRRPLRLLARLRNDPEFLALFKEDLRYAGACGFFSGRRPPDYARMTPFGRHVSR